MILAKRGLESPDDLRRLDDLLRRETGGAGAA
jgi:hypothetical protein